MHTHGSELSGQLKLGLPTLAALRAQGKVRPQFAIRFRVDPMPPRAFNQFLTPFAAGHRVTTSGDAFIRLSLADSNARARCRRDRTVPTGRPISLATSS